MRIFAETMDPDNLRRDEEKEDLVLGMIRDNDTNVGSFLNDFGEGMPDPDPQDDLDDFDDDKPEGEADGSGSSRDIICTSTTQSGEVYSLNLSADYMDHLHTLTLFLLLALRIGPIFCKETRRGQKVGR